MSTNSIRDRSTCGNVRFWEWREFPAHNSISSWQTWLLLQIQSWSAIINHCSNITLDDSHVCAILVTSLDLARKMLPGYTSRPRPLLLRTCSSIFLQKSNIPSHLPRRNWLSSSPILNHIASFTKSLYGTKGKTKSQFSLICFGVVTWTEFFDLW